MSYKKKTYQKREVQRVPFVLKFPPSEAQMNIKQELLLSSDNILCNAVAGSGKSTTLKWLMTFVKGSGAYVAFNKDIVKEMEPDCPPHVTVKTRHAFGYAAFAQQRIRLQIDDRIMETILEECGYPMKVGDKDFSDRVRNMITMLAQLRNNLTDIYNIGEVGKIADFYGIDIDVWDEFIMKLPMIYEKIVSYAMKGIIDFVSMKWVPVHMNWKLQQFKYLWVDECQDSSTLDMEFDKKMVAPGGRVILVGDPYQSIYGFAGANCNSVQLLAEFFDVTECPLSTTFRCSKNIVKESKYIVPHLEAFEKAPDGEVIRAGNYPAIPDIDWATVNPNAMVLCRRNAPLVRPCFACLKQGIKANIKGRDIGKNLISTIKGLKATDIPSMLDKLDAATTKKIDTLRRRKNPSQAAIDAAEDSRSIVYSFCEQPDIKTLDELYRYIERLFSDEVEGIMFSSGHKSKGLEADEVIVLEHSRIRIHNENMTDEQKQQEKNLEYVVKTRGKTRMIYTEA